MNTLSLQVLISCFSIASIQSIPVSPGQDSTVKKIDDILAEWWKVGDRWQYSTLSVIGETECDNLKENVNQIQNFLQQKYSSNPLTLKIVEILVNGKERYHNEEVCRFIHNDKLQDLLLQQAMEIDYGHIHTKPLRKNITNVLMSAINRDPSINLSQVLCLTRLWSQKTIEKTSKFFKTQQRIKKWFELNIDPIISLYERPLQFVVLNCDMSLVKQHVNPPKYKSIELLLVEALNVLTSELNIFYAPQSETINE